MGAERPGFGEKNERDPSRVVPITPVAAQARRPAAGAVTDGNIGGLNSGSAKGIE